ncbi:hypothetical protein Cpir12675_006427 [Ceratocystis pirilliformis]|uniref:Uncharacterized protein n=1 Tax=Ceratocystis pirilliformis TaxID=259994 RepID=A0ABR3YHE2_9PEZI
MTPSFARLALTPARSSFAIAGSFPVVVFQLLDPVNIPILILHSVSTAHKSPITHWMEGSPKTQGGS